jgi:phage terminase small subunit
VSKARQCTPKQLRFVEEYVIDLNGEASAKRAGYHPVYSHELLKKPWVREEIAKRQEKASQDTGVTPERVLQEISRIAFCDVREAFNADGTLKAIRTLPDDLARAVSAVEVKETRGKEKKGAVRKLRFWAKDRALQQLGQHFKLFTEVHEIRGAEELMRRLNAAKKRIGVRP